MLKLLKTFPVLIIFDEMGILVDFLFDTIIPSSPAEFNSGKFIGERISLLEIKLRELAKSILEDFFVLLLCKRAI